MKIVGVTGFKKSGKDIFARPFIDDGYVLGKFADALKQMIRTLLRLQGVDEKTIERMIEGDLKEFPSRYLNNRSPRHAMVTLGTEWGRVHLGEELWVNVVQNWIRSRPLDIKGVIFTDMRFPNERDAVRNMSGTLFRVNRSAVTPDDFSTLHPSEAHVPTLKVDAEVFNETSVEDFERVALATKKAWGL